MTRDYSLTGMETGADVQFKQSKRYKKRKELDALVSSTTSSNNNLPLVVRTSRSNGLMKGMRSGSHELLRTHSDTSDLEEYVKTSHVPRKKQRSHRFCSLCMPLFVFVLVAACIVCSATLIKIQLQLKGELDQLRADVEKDESSAKKEAEEMTSIKLKLSKLEELISTIQSGPSGLESIGANITLLNAQVQSLNQSVGALKQSVSAAADLVKLPQTVNSIAESMANIGSESEATKQTVKDLSASKKDYEDFKVQTTKTVEDLQKNVVSLNQSRSASSQPSSSLSSSSSTSSAASDTERLADMVTELSSFAQKQVARINGEISGINASLQATIVKNEASMLSHQVALNRVRNDTQSLRSKLDNLNLGGGAFDVKHELQVMATELLQNLTESLSTGGSSELSSDQLEEIKLQVDTLERRFEEYKTSHADDLNNNLINLNTTKAMEDEISRTFNAFRDEYGLDVKDFKDQVQLLVSVTASHNASLFKLKHEVQEILHILDALIGNDTGNNTDASESGADEPSHDVDYVFRDVDDSVDSGMVDGAKTSFGDTFSDLQGADSRKRPKKAR